MDNLLVWILIFAGATIGLLATFLIASERELKAQRDEIQETGAEPMAKAMFMAEPVVSAAALGALPERDETIDKNRELVRELNQLKDQLHSSQSTAQWLQERLTGLERHKSELAETNGVLQAELEAIKRHVQTSAASDDKTRQEREQGELQNRQLEQEIAGLKAQQKNSGEFAAELETLRKQLAISDGIETELITIRRELADQQRMNGDLKDDNLRLREQIFEIQRQLDIGVSDGQRLVLAQQRLSAILAQHETLSSTAQEMQSTLVQLSELLINQPGVQAWPQPAVQQPYDEPRAENRADPIELTDRHESVAVEISAERLYGAKEAALISSTSSERRASKPHGKFVSLVVFVLALGAIAAQAWRLDPAQESGQAIFPNQSALRAWQTPALNTSAARPEAHLQGSLATQTAPSPKSNDALLLGHKRGEQPQGNRAASKISIVPSQAANEKTHREKAKTTKNSAASYEIVHAAQVFREPNESAESIAQIEAGMEVNVVNAHNGWLEVRSKHGRPPGFIKHDTAVRARRD